MILARVFGRFRLPIVPNEADGKAVERERIDQILLRMGFVTDDEVERALQHQKVHGGRLGSTLVYLGFVGEAELVHALCEQHKVPGFFLDEHRIHATAVRKMPASIALKHHILPFAFDRTAGTVSVAAIDPGDRDMITAVKKAFHAGTVELFVASESLLRLLVTHYYRRPKATTDEDPTEGRETKQRRKSRSAKKSLGRGFRGSLGALSFIDLLQTLAQGAKTVHVRLSGPDREHGEVYLRRGRMVHAECGSVTGVDAIYRIIGWGETGTFRVEKAQEFPNDNIFEANEAILMEGCRLMDEASVNPPFNR
jgi:hypothetical protein